MVHRAIPSGASRPNLLNGLVAKRAELAGKLAANQAEGNRLANELRTLDAAIYIFEPDVNLSAVAPKPLCARDAAHRGEVTRIVCNALRAATSPLTSHDLTRVVLLERDLPASDAELFKLMRKRVGACLLTKKEQGLVRSFDVGGPLLAWELIR